jgi:hypothetical protein
MADDGVCDPSLLDSDLATKTSKVMKSTGMVPKEREMHWVPIIAIRQK